MGKRILIVDDAAFMRMMIKDILTKNGYEVAAEAENGKIAIDKFKEVSPDLTLLDITMPEMDGVEALKEIMKVDPDAYDIMITAAGQQDKVVEALKSGANLFIMKPFNEEDVIKNFENVLK